MARDHIGDTVITRTDSLPNFIEDITNITKEKLGGTNDILLEDLDNKIEQIGAQIEVNGIIKQYTAGAKIEANNFVESYTENNTTKVRKFSGGNIVGFCKESAEEGTTVSVITPGEVSLEPEISIDLNPNNKSDNAQFAKETNTDYYVSQNSAFGTYSLCRINIKSTKKLKFTITICSYSQSDNFNQAQVSYLDKSFSKNSFIERLNITKANIKSNSAEDFKKINFIIPGDNKNHYIEIKYVINRILAGIFGSCRFSYNYQIVD